jgi:VanZ family protein
MKERFWPESRSDFVANFLLGLPLGFSLLAWIRFDAPNRIGTAIWGACLLPVCAAFAALVEFGQLYFPGRTCAGSDVVAQVAGASVGILIWVAFSQTLLEQLRRALTHPHVGSGAVRIFAGYFLLLALVQWLPLDLSASPSDLLRRFRDGHVTWEPLGELAGKPGEPPPNLWKKGEAWAELICLTLPLGLLLSTLPGRWESGEAWPAALGLSLAAGAILEGGQLFVQSRHPSTTDVLLTGLSAWSGWGLGLVLQRRSIRRQRRLWAFPLAGFWLTLLTIQAWQPFEFDSQILDTNWSRVGWFPLAGQAEKNYLWALNELLAKIVVYFPLGALVAWAWLQRWPKVAIGGSSLICGIAALILEVGQFAMPTRFAPGRGRRWGRRCLVSTSCRVFGADSDISGQ